MTAPTFDASSHVNPGSDETHTSTTWNHTVTGSNPYLLVFLAFRVAGGMTGASSVTYNGTSLTQLGAATNGSTGAEVWGLANPATGTHAVVANWTAASTADVCGAASCTGADLTGGTNTSPIRGGAATTATGTSSAPSVTVSSNVNDLVFDGIGVSSLVTISSVGSGQTQDYVDADAGSNVRRGASSHEAGASSVVMDWTLSASGVWSSMGVSVMGPSGGGGGATMFRQVPAELGVAYKRGHRTLG